ncbi:hypothetical protein [Runella zeae]|uniref:hypothetical protein n=1 Tax=Runella zeae TaxID=94255 RepID=UPI000422703A|nr:hypothetical protein [Runella zeae]
MEYYLNGTRIKEPGGMAGFYLEKQYSNFFEGFVRRSIGHARVQGVGNISFDEPLAVLLLDNARKQSILDEDVIFEMRDKGQVVSRANIDFATFSKNKNVRQVGVIDKLGDILEIQVAEEISILPFRKIRIPATTLASRVSWKIDADGSFAIIEKRNQSQYINHNIPFKLDSKETLANGSVYSITSDSSILYSNTTSQQKSVEIECFISFFAQTNTPTTCISALYLADKNGLLVRKIADVVYDIDSEMKEFTGGVSQKLQINPDCSILLKMESTNSVDSHTFKYKTESYFRLSDDDVSDSEVWCLSAYDAMSALLTKIDSNLTLTPSSKAFLEASGLYFTNGFNLRGFKKPISTSLQVIFNDLKVLTNATLNLLETNQVSVEGYKKNSATTFIKDIYSIEYQPDMGSIYNEIKVGYKNFESSSASGNLEKNSLLTYHTKVKRGRAGLELICNSIASSKSIESIRRIRFDQQITPSSDISTDGKLFVISAKAGVATIKGDQLNGNLLPETILFGHQEKWSHLAPLTLTNSTSSYYDSRIGENTKPTQGAEYNGDVAIIAANITTREFSQLSKCIIFHDGPNEIIARVTNASHRPFRRESGYNTIITAKVQQS